MCKWITYNYLFVDRHWLEKYILVKTYYDKAIVIYRYGFDNVNVFKYVNNKLLRYENQNFTRWLKYIIIKFMYFFNKI